jgi:hypothetical protein
MKMVGSDGKFVYKATKYEAIISLVGGDISSLGDEITYHSGQTPPSDSDIDAEVIRLQAEYDAQEYARTRRPEYPDIGDQLDDLYHKGAFSDEMAVKIKAVKDAHPKPE